MKKTDSTKLQSMIGTIEAQIAFVDDLHTEAETSYAAKSENWQLSEKGEEAYQQCEDLQAVVDALEEAKNNLENIVQNA